VLKETPYNLYLNHPVYKGREPLEREVRELAERLGMRLHRFNDYKKHWRGFVLQWEDDDPLEGKIIYHSHDRMGIWLYLLRQAGELGDDE
jgi:hypothetical protein